MSTRSFPLSSSRGGPPHGQFDRPETPLFRLSHTGRVGGRHHVIGAVHVHASHAGDGRAVGAEFVDGLCSSLTSTVKGQPPARMRATSAWPMKPVPPVQKDTQVWLHTAAFIAQLCGVGSSFPLTD